MQGGESTWGRKQRLEDVATSPWTPGATEAGRGKEGVSPGPSLDGAPLSLWTVGLQNREQINLYYFKPSTCSNKLQQSSKTNIVSNTAHSQRGWNGPQGGGNCFLEGGRECMKKSEILQWFVTLQRTTVYKQICSLSVGGLFAKSCPTLATPWTVAHPAPLSMGFSRQEYWSGLPFPSSGDLSDPGIKPSSL